MPRATGPPRLGSGLTVPANERVGKLPALQSWHLAVPVLEANVLASQGLHELSAVTVAAWLAPAGAAGTRAVPLRKASVPVGQGCSSVLSRPV